MIHIKLNDTNAPSLTFTAFEKEEVLGTLACTVHEETGTITITSLSCVRFLVDGLCRTALDYGARHGLLRCVFEISDQEMLTALIQEGFVTPEKKEISDAEIFLKTHKNCGK